MDKYRQVDQSKIQSFHDFPKISQDAIICSETEVKKIGNFIRKLWFDAQIYLTVEVLWKPCLWIFKLNILCLFMMTRVVNNKSTIGVHFKYFIKTVFFTSAYMYFQETLAYDTNIYKMIFTWILLKKDKAVCVYLDTVSNPITKWF